MEKDFMKLRWLLMGAGILFFIPKTRGLILQTIAKIMDSDVRSEAAEVKS